MAWVVGGPGTLSVLTSSGYGSQLSTTFCCSGHSKCEVQGGGRQLQALSQTFTGGTEAAGGGGGGGGVSQRRSAWMELKGGLSQGDVRPRGLGRKGSGINTPGCVHVYTEEKKKEKKLECQFIRSKKINK